MQDPAIAIVVDPKRTISAGKVEVGCFRTYPKDYKSDAKTSNRGLEMIDEDKAKDFGVYADRYYKIPCEIFKSRVDDMVLERLWNEYWVQSLASSPLLKNADLMNKSVINVVKSLNKITSLHNTQARKQSGQRGSENKVIDKEEWTPIEQESTKLAVDSCHGVMLEHFKAMMFT